MFFSFFSAVLPAATAYLLAAMFATVVLIRVRPEWMLGKVDPAQRNGGDKLAGLTRAERRTYATWEPYSTIYKEEKAAFEELSRRRMADHGEAGVPTWATVDETWARAAFAPLLLLFALPVSICVRGAVKSVNTSERTRTAIEQELAAARKEIDDLLRKEE